MAIDSKVTNVSFEVATMEDSSCWRLARVVDKMLRDPSYQRQGSVWSKSRKQAFVDSLLNGFDIPKIYLHEGGPERGSRRYAIVDGKQRLETLVEFYEGRLRLAQDFRLINSEKLSELGLAELDSASLAGKTYAEVEETAPALAKYLDQRKLDVKVIRTEDLDVIEEMFWRLNEAATLNGPEHRRGIGGPAIEAIDEIVKHGFFECLPFTDRRYRHQDLAVKMLLWSARGKTLRPSGSRNEIPDTKRLNLDAFVKRVRDARDDPSNDTFRSFDESKHICIAVLDELEAIYEKSDRVLARLGTVAVVYLQALRVAMAKSPLNSVVTRDEFLCFEEFREDKVKNVDEGDELAPGLIALIDYGTLAQSSNDGAALLRRVEILETYVMASRQGTDPLTQLGDI